MEFSDHLGLRGPTANLLQSVAAKLFSNTSAFDAFMTKI